MSIIHFVTFSGSVDAVAVVAGAPYGCNVLPDHDNACATPTPNEVPLPDVPMDTYLQGRAAAGQIDPISNMAGKKAYLFAGTLDSQVYTPVMAAVRRQLEYYNGVANVVSEFSVPAEHAWIVNGPWGNPCGYFGSPYINNCGYDTAGTMLAAMYGPLYPTGPPAGVPGQLLWIDQAKHLPPGSWKYGGIQGISMGRWGLAYVPTGCAGGILSCRHHVNYHGCGAEYEYLGEQWVTGIGLNGWAEANNIVVIYPQAHSSVLRGNPNGCWDWEGFVSDDFDTHGGLQLQVVISMINNFGAEYAAGNLTTVQSVNQTKINLMAA